MSIKAALKEAAPVRLPDPVPPTLRKQVQVLRTQALLPSREARDVIENLLREPIRRPARVRAR